MLHKIVRWLKRPAPKPKTEEEIIQERQEAQDEAILQAGRLKKLTLAENTGWKDYCLLIQDYIDKILQRKIVTRLDTATEGTKRQLELNDRDVATLEWVLQIPQQFIINLEQELEEQKKKEEPKEE